MIFGDPELPNDNSPAANRRRVNASRTAPSNGRGVKMQNRRTVKPSPTQKRYIGRGRDR